MFNVFKGLVGSKTVTHEDMQPVLDKMKDHLIGIEVYLFCDYLKRI